MKDFDAHEANDSGADGSGADPDRPDGEDELRLLLEHAVPHLSAPAERIRLVRRLVVRRRRRRAALVTVVTGVVAVAALVPLLRLPHGATSAALPGASGSPPSSGPATSASGRPNDVLLSPGEYGPMQLPDAGASLNLPVSWKLYRVPTPGAETVLTDFITNESQSGTDSCAISGAGVFSCAPTRLTEGGVVVSFRQQPATTKNTAGLRTKAPFMPGPPGPADEGCRTLGGDRELIAPGLPRADGNQLVQVNAYACFKGATELTLTIVQKALQNAVLGTLPTEDPSTAQAH